MQFAAFVKAEFEEAGPQVGLYHGFSQTRDFVAAVVAVSHRRGVALFLNLAAQYNSGGFPRKLPM